MSSEVKVIVVGDVGTAKSALLMELEVAMRAIGLPVRWENPDEERFEKSMLGGDAYSSLENMPPDVVLLERNPHQLMQELPQYFRGMAEVACHHESDMVREKFANRVRALQQQINEVLSWPEMRQFAPSAPAQ